MLVYVVMSLMMIAKQNMKYEARLPEGEDLSIYEFVEG